MCTNNSGPIQGETTDSSVTFWVLVKNVTDLSVVDNNSEIKFKEVIIKEDTLVNKFYKKLKPLNIKSNFPLWLFLFALYFNAK